MCRAAFVANNPTDAQFHQHTILLDGPGIAAKESHPSSFVTTWANKLVDLDAGNDTVINFLRNRIATINKNGYHKYKRMGQFYCFQVVVYSPIVSGNSRKPNIGVGGSCFIFYSYKPIITEGTE